MTKDPHIICSQQKAAGDAICGQEAKTSGLCLAYMLTVVIQNLDKVITTMVMTFSSLDDLTTSHDVLNMWSLICDPSAWGTWESGMSSFGSPPRGSY